MKIRILFVLLCLVSALSAQTLTQERADSFIRTLVFARADLEKYFDPIDFEQSNRLRIMYEGVDWKILIGHDIETSIREKIKTNEIGYSLKIRPLEAPYSKLLFTTSDSTYKQVFFFKNDLMISPLTYFTRNMVSFQRKNVIFYTSDPSLVSYYSMNQVNKFIARQFFKYSGFVQTKSSVEKPAYEDDYTWRYHYGIRYNPIIYIVCKDEHQIEQITGIKTAGLTDLSMDAVISTSNSHYHELMHIIMNFNLSPIPLYTHPLLQEGVATCEGGRSGKSAGVMLQMGTSLKNMDIIPIDTLLSRQSFLAQDASVSYPLSALICKRYIDMYGIKKFRELYKKYSTTEETIHNMTISEADVNLAALFSKTSWNPYYESVISISAPVKGKSRISFPKSPQYKSPDLSIWEVTVLKSLNSFLGSYSSNEAANAFWDKVFPENSRSYHKFEGLGTFMNRQDDTDVYYSGKYKAYRSRIFKEKFPDRKYNFQHYLLSISENEISLYDLYLDQLIASYNNEFAPPDQQITVQNGKVTFFLDLNQPRFKFKPDNK